MHLYVGLLKDENKEILHVQHKFDLYITIFFRILTNDQPYSFRI